MNIKPVRLKEAAALYALEMEEGASERDAAALASRLFSVTKLEVQNAFLATGAYASAVAYAKLLYDATYGSWR